MALGALDQCPRLDIHPPTTPPKAKLRLEVFDLECLFNPHRTGRNNTGGLVKLGDGCLRPTVIVM